MKTNLPVKVMLSFGMMLYGIVVTIAQPINQKEYWETMGWIRNKIEQFSPAQTPVQDEPLLIITHLSYELNFWDDCSCEYKISSRVHRRVNDAGEVGRQGEASLLKSYTFNLSNLDPGQVFVKYEDLRSGEEYKYPLVSMSTIRKSQDIKSTTASAFYFSEYPPSSSSETAATLLIPIANQDNLPERIKKAFLHAISLCSKKQNVEKF